MSKPLTLSDWIAHVFDHPVTDPAWHWSLDAPQWEDTAERIASFIADTFEDSGKLLSRFIDAQLRQGLWYLASGDCSEFMFALKDPEVPLESRLRALRSFVPLFEQVLAVRCSPHLSHLDEQPANPLNGVCYMWWDLLPICGASWEPDHVEFGTEALRVLSQLLCIPHDACRESALHGLGHWRLHYSRAESIIDDWLGRTPNLRPELVSYAECARIGDVL